VVLADIIALVCEGRLRDITKIPYALLLGYITTPITAVGAIKGLLTGHGYFNRTHKTGKITKPSILNRLKGLFKL
jgi:hypothetical protein